MKTLTLVLLTTTLAAAADTPPPVDWMARWQRYIVADSRSRTCDKETGEEIGWLVSPYLDGFCYGYFATGDPVWIDRLADWTDSWTKRGIKEPDGFVGWPKADGASTQVVPGLFTDNQLGEAMGLRPALVLAAAILKSPELSAKYGDRAKAWIALAEQNFAKWDARGCWRQLKVGGVWVVPTFGLDGKGGWTEGYARKGVDGFTLPANKQNYIARFELALFDATGKTIYRDRAEQWFQQFKSRWRTKPDTKFLVWNYWDPAGPWDYKPGGGTKHWVGVHPNGGYYLIDNEGIVAAYEHHLVFTETDIDQLIITNRDFMWNQKIQGAKFASIDAGLTDARWKDSPGVLWVPLVLYDDTLRQIFEANHKPDSWSGMGRTPWYVALRLGKLPPGA
jgi:hypothetical protein